MDKFLQLLQNTSDQNAFNMLYQLYKTINTSCADDLIAFWHTLSTFESNVSDPGIFQTVEHIQYAMVQRMKSLAAEIPTPFAKISGQKKLSLQEEFENTIGEKLNNWGK
ncbi:MAG: hypothetical protein WCH65_01690 [bacterium]